MRGVGFVCFVLFLEICFVGFRTVGSCTPILGMSV